MDEAQALERLRTVLARPEFVAAAQRGWRERVWAALGDLLYSLWIAITSALAGGGGSGAGGDRAWLAWLILAVAILALAGGAVYVSRAVGLSVAREATERRAAAQRRARSDQFWRHAQALASDGRLGEALPPLYLSALYALHERGALSIQAGQTNAEHARRVRPDVPALGGLFSRLVERYDRLRYDVQPVERASFDELRGLVAETRSAALDQVRSPKPGI